jgi:hypothetical protein
MAKVFPVGSVGHNLTLMCGVWHDHCEAFSPSGEPLAEDALSGTPGASPWDNLVYVSFDGESYRQTNVTFQGRPAHERTFHGKLVEGVLYFGKLGPDDPDHIGYSGGPGVLFFSGKHVTDAWQRYAEPDCIRLVGTSERTRTTLLYRNGVAVRCLTANGTRIAPVADRRVPWDPRGPEGPVHGEPKATLVFAKP